MKNQIFKKNVFCHQKKALLFVLSMVTNTKGVWRCDLAGSAGLPVYTIYTHQEFAVFFNAAL
jgi:hypothetical protein